MSTPPVSRPAGPGQRIRVRVGTGGVRAEVDRGGGADLLRLCRALKRTLTRSAPYPVAAPRIAEVSPERLVVDARRRG